MFVVFCSRKPFFLKCLQHFFQVDMEPLAEKNIGIWSNEWGWIVGEKTLTPRWMTIAEASKSYRELIECRCKTKCTRQWKCKKYQLRCREPYIDALEIATIELVFNEFYSIVFFSKQWTKLDFLKKSTNNVI